MNAHSVVCHLNAFWNDFSTICLRRTIFRAIKIMPVFDFIMRGIRQRFHIHGLRESNFKPSGRQPDG